MAAERNSDSRRRTLNRIGERERNRQRVRRPPSFRNAYAIAGCLRRASISLLSCFRFAKESSCESRPNRFGTATHPRRWGQSFWIRRTNRVSQKTNPSTFSPPFVCGISSSPSLYNLGSTRMCHAMQTNSTGFFSILFRSFAAGGKPGKLRALSHR